MIAVLTLTYTLHMDLSCFSKLTTMLALRYWTSFLLDLEERAVGMLAGRGAVTFNARLATH